MLSVISVLAAVLVLGVFGVGIVTCFGWRERMRRKPEVWADHVDDAA
jgi:hypothetical protein